MQFFKRTYQSRVKFKQPLSDLKTKILDFRENDTVMELYYDELRDEGYVKGNSYYITFELHLINNEIILDVTTTCKIPFMIPKMYFKGFISFLELDN